jgi:hypothetical protein
MKQIPKEDIVIIKMIKSGLKNQFMSKKAQTAFVKQIKKDTK